MKHLILFLFLLLPFSSIAQSNYIGGSHGKLIMLTVGAIEDNQMFFNYLANEMGYNNTELNFTPTKTGLSATLQRSINSQLKLQYFCNEAGENITKVIIAGKYDLLVELVVSYFDMPPTGAHYVDGVIEFHQNAKETITLYYDKIVIKKIQ